MPTSGDEFDVTVGLGKQRVVAATPDVFARVYFRTSLADNDVARFDEFTPVPLNA